MGGGRLTAVHHDLDHVGAPADAGGLAADFADPTAGAYGCLKDERAYAPRLKESTLNALIDWPAGMRPRGNEAALPAARRGVNGEQPDDA